MNYLQKQNNLQSRWNIIATRKLVYFILLILATSCDTEDEHKIYTNIKFIDLQKFIPLSQNHISFVSNNLKTRGFHLMSQSGGIGSNFISLNKTPSFRHTSSLQIKSEHDITALNNLVHEFMKAKKLLHEDWLYKQNTPSLIEVEVRYQTTLTNGLFYYKISPIKKNEFKYTYYVEESFLSQNNTRATTR